MKKKVVLLLTLIVSLFIYSGRVNAAKEMTCLYSGKYALSGGIKMLILHSDGTHEFFYGGYYQDQNDILINSVEDINKKIYFKYNIKDNKNDVTFSDGITDSCYKYITLRMQSQDNIIKEMYFNLSNTKEETVNNTYNNIRYTTVSSELISEFDSDIKDPVIDKPFVNSENIDDIWQDKYDGRCNYGDFIIYFKNSDNSSIFFKNNTNIDYQILFNADEFVDIYSGECPEVIYRKFFVTTAPRDVKEMHYELYLNRESLSNEVWLYGDNSALYTDEYKRRLDGRKDNNVEIDSCEKLIGDDVINKISKYFNIIKIVIPILLIGFGILDFSKSVFAKEEDMKKAQKTFVMRILAGILFFLLPLFIKLILSIANNVWDYINPGSCLKY